MSDFQETVAETLRDMGRATSPEIAERLGCVTSGDRNRVARACKVLLKFRIIRVAEVRRIGCHDVRVYELTEESA